MKSVKRIFAYYVRMIIKIHDKIYLGDKKINKDEILKEKEELRKIIGISDISDNINKREIYGNGDNHIGEFKNNLINGKRILYYNKNNEYERDIYKGEWKNGIIEGKGIMNWKNADI